jgi:hypothetical protein
VLIFNRLQYVIVGSVPRGLESIPYSLHSGHQHHRYIGKFPVRAFKQPDSAKSIIHEVGNYKSKFLSSLQKSERVQTSSGFRAFVDESNAHRSSRYPGFQDQLLAIQQYLPHGGEYGS